MNKHKQLEQHHNNILFILDKRNVDINTKRQVREEIDNFINPKPLAFSFISDEDKMRDFNLLTKSKFLKEYPEISEESYKITEEELE